MRWIKGKPNNGCDNEILYVKQRDKKSLIIFLENCWNWYYMGIQPAMKIKDKEWDTIEYLLNEDIIQEIEDNPKAVGVLNKPIGIVGYKLGVIGTIVNEQKDRYFITLESLDGKSAYNVTYYKDTLEPYINFYERNSN